jgi:tripeptide aminopeptidase
MVERMIKQFMEMVKIDSESGNEAQFIDYLLAEFKKLGADARKDAYGNLVAKFAAKNSASKEAILLSCHADTVMPGRGITPKMQKGVIRSSGDTILGADDKAGIAEMLEALRLAETRPPVEVAISRQEEVGLLGIKNLDLPIAPLTSISRGARPMPAWSRKRASTPSWPRPRLLPPCAWGAWTMKPRPTWA